MTPEPELKNGTPETARYGKSLHQVVAEQLRSLASVHIAYEA
jgi:hypothetical protein